MALLLKQTSEALFKDSVRKLEYTQIRFAKSPGQSQKGFKRQPIMYGMWKNPGDRVDCRALICSQKRLWYHPGLNVGIIPRNRSLYAMCSGTIYFTIEKFSPNRENSIVSQMYNDKVVMKEKLELTPRYIKYVHVVPDKPTNEFKLIDVV